MAENNENPKNFLKKIMDKAKSEQTGGHEGKWADKSGIEGIMQKPLHSKSKDETKEQKKEIDNIIQEKEEKSEVELKLEKEEKKTVAEYGDVKIFEVPSLPLATYTIPVPKPNVNERNIINTLKEAATRLISIEPYKIRDPEQRRLVYFQKIMDILEATPELNIPKHKFSFYADIVVKEMVGYGLLDDLIRDDLLEEIMVVGCKKPVYVFHRNLGMLLSNIQFYSEQEIEDLINRIAREVGRRVDISSPLLDARLADGSRVNATIPPASVDGATLTIRKFREDPYSIIDLINFKTLDEETAAFLWLAVEGYGTLPANILISGGASSGKTTLLNVLGAFIPPRERVISIEDTAELKIPLEHWIRLESRPPGLEGTGEITLEMLSKNALRMRPDRIMVGEVRGDEAFTLFSAMNVGHRGSMGTIHANSTNETVIRVTSPPMNVPKVMLAGLDLIVMQQKFHDKKLGVIRRVTDIAELGGVAEADLKTKPIFERDPVSDTMTRTSMPSLFMHELRAYTGMSENKLNEEIQVRADFLNNLKRQGKRSIIEVNKAVTEFLAERK